MAKENLLLSAFHWPSKQLRKLYSWTIRWAGSKNAPYALFAIAFAESFFFPIPPDVLLIPMVVAKLKDWLKNALICTLGSLTGAIFGYAIGWGLYEVVGQPIVDFYGLQPQMDAIGQRYASAAFLTIFTAAFTPIPYKVITISAGLFGISIPTLMIASALGRGARFFLVAGALKIFGKKIADAIEKYFDIFSLIFAALLIGGFLIFKYLL